MSDNQRSFFAKLEIVDPRPVNTAWLEKQAIEIEQLLIDKCAGTILGPSVTANFEDNALEIDLTVEAETPSEAYEKANKAVEMAEAHAGLVAAADKDDQVDEIHRSYDKTSPPPHEAQTLAAC